MGRLPRLGRLEHLWSRTVRGVATIDKITGRTTYLSLYSDDASDELLLQAITEACRVDRPTQQDASIVVSYGTKKLTWRHNANDDIQS